MCLAASKAFRWMLLICAAMLQVAPLLALESINGDLSLLPDPPPKSELLGITFEETPGKVLRALAERGLTMRGKEVLDDKRLIQVFTFEGLPSEFGLKGGLTRLTFFRNQLVALDFEFPPTYKNFLVIKDKLFSSLGGRFSLEKKQEFMDDDLRAHLAHLKPGQFGSGSEQKIRQAMVAGSTFFHYVLKDKQAEFRATYAYVALGKTVEERNPSLMMHFGLKSAIAEMREYSHAEHKEENPGILP